MSKQLEAEVQRRLRYEIAQRIEAIKTTPHGQPVPEPFDVGAREAELRLQLTTQAQQVESRATWKNLPFNDRVRLARERTMAVEKELTSTDHGEAPLADRMRDEPEAVLQDAALFDPDLRGDVQELEREAQLRSADARTVIAHSLGRVLEHIPGTLRQTAVVGEAASRAALDPDPTVNASTRGFMAVIQSEEGRRAAVEALSDRELFALAGQAQELHQRDVRQNPQHDPIEAMTQEQIEAALRDEEKRFKAQQAQGPAWTDRTPSDPGVAGMVKELRELGLTHTDDGTPLDKFLPREGAQKE